MTKDLAILVEGTMQVHRSKYLNTFEFIDKVAETLNHNLTGVQGFLTKQEYKGEMSPFCKMALDGIKQLIKENGLFVMN